MVQGCCNNLAKLIVVIANFLVGLFGAVLLGVSLFAKYNHGIKTQLADLVDDKTISALESLQHYSNLLTALAIFGGIIFLIGFLGCCGACCDNKCLLGLYFVAILLCAIVELALAIAIFTQQDKIEIETNKIVNEAFAPGGGINGTVLHQLEESFNCCGKGGKVSSTGAACPIGSKGCAQAVYDVIDGGLVAVGVVAILAVIVQVVAMVFACCLYSAIGKRQGYMEYA